MPVSITFSETNGGTAVSDPVDHGGGSAGEALTAQTIHIRHDGDNRITNCGLFLDAAESYTGDFSAADDLAELLAWGDETAEDDFGGIMVNMDAEASFPSSQWPTYSDKAPTNGAVFRTGVGDSAANKIPLSIDMGLEYAGIISAGDTPNARLQFRVQIPTNESTLGVRQVDTKLRFTYTS